MKELKNLERRMYASECIHTCMMTLFIAIPIALLFKEDDQMYRLLWAIGTVIPVQLIRIICLHINKKLIRILLVLGLFAATIFVTRKEYHYSYYSLTCLLIALSGLFLPRPNGRLLFTVPNIPSLVLAFVPYGIGVIAHIPLLSRIAIVLSALATLNYLLYINQSRLFKDIRMAYDTEVSVTGLIRQNRKVVAAFVIAGIFVLTAIPFILRAAPPKAEEIVEQTQEIETQTPTPTPFIPKNYMKSPEGKEFNLDFFPLVLGFLFLLIPATVLFGLVYLIYTLLSGIEGRRKQELPDVKETMTIERLAPESLMKEKEHLSGYEKRIRRRYGKLIKSRASKEARLAVLTPTELEQAADIQGDGAETIHEIYRKTRYSSEPVVRESYIAFRDAVRKLPVSIHSENAAE